MKIHLVYGEHHESPVNLGPGVPLDIDIDSQRIAHLFQAVDGDLHIELYRTESRPAQRSPATSAIVMRYGCGHELYLANGDTMWPACPWCNERLRLHWHGAEPMRATPRQVWEVVDGAVQTVGLFETFEAALAWAQGANEREGSRTMYFAQPKPREILSADTVFA